MTLKEKVKTIFSQIVIKLLSFIRNLKSHICMWGNIFVFKKKIRRINRLHSKTLHKISHKNCKIKCAFLALDQAVWKYDGIYKIMEESDLFDPIVLVCPIINFGKENMLAQMNACYKLMKEKGYNVRKSYNANDNTYLDVRKDINPDIIFYTNPYKGLIDDRYFIDKYPDILTVYVPYSYTQSQWYHFNYGSLFPSFLWRYYLETNSHYKDAKKYSKNNAKNIIVSGFPGIDNFINCKYKPKDIWKQDKKKRIIWAPHHTIEPVGIINYSCFMSICDFFVELANKYQNEVQFVFKPHPLLRNKLTKEWGKEKTDNYYNMWNTMPNTMLQEGEYIDLFLTSDAMIHDSGSFLIEYLYTCKPVMRTMNDIDPQSMYNDFALDALDVYYKGYNKQDIEQFIQNVIDAVDPMKEAREKFYQERLLPPNGKLPSENIVNDIIDSIKNQRVFA